MCGCLSHPPWGVGTWPATQACALELNWRLFGSRACTQSTEPHQPGLPFFIFNSQKVQSLPWAGHPDSLSDGKRFGGRRARFQLLSLPAPLKFQRWGTQGGEMGRWTGCTPSCWADVTGPLPLPRQATHHAALGVGQPRLFTRQHARLNDLGFQRAEDSSLSPNHGF